MPAGEAQAPDADQEGIGEVDDDEHEHEHAESMGSEMPMDRSREVADLTDSSNRGGDGRISLDTRPGSSPIQGRAESGNPADVPESAFRPGDDSMATSGPEDIADETSTTPPPLSPPDSHLPSPPPPPSPSPPAPHIPPPYEHWPYVNTVLANLGMPITQWFELVIRGHRFPGLGKVTGYEIAESTIVPHASNLRVRLRYKGGNWAANSAAIHDFWHPARPTGQCRLLVVEDLSPTLIDALGAALELDPLVFVRHLQESGAAQTSAQDEWTCPATDSYLDGQVVSLRWHRPVLTIVNNAVRSRRTRPLVDLGGDWSDDKPEPMTVDDWRAKSEWRNKNSKKTTNIFRKEWIIGIKAARTHPSRSQADMLAKASASQKQSPPLDGLVPSSWLEKATIYQERRDGLDFVLILTDPLPKVDSSGEGVEIETSGEGIAEAGRAGAQPIPSTTCLPYKPMSARWTCRTGRWSRQLTQMRYPQHMRTTAKDMLSWMTNISFAEGMRRPRRGRTYHLTMPQPVWALFMVVFLDTAMFLDAFGKCLGDIRSASSDETLLRQFVDGWIQLLARGQAELRAVHRSVEEFAERYFGPGQHLPGEVQRSVVEIRRRLHAAIAETDDAYAFVRAEFAALEARKQVTESESVTRLTELAFLFIPLSFVASAFSMQVQELQSPPPLAAFFATSLGVLALAYALRLIIRSAAFVRATHSAAQAVRSQSGIPYGQPIPTRAAAYSAAAFAAYPVVTPWAVAAAVAAAIVWLWVARQRLDAAFKVTLTVLALVGIVAPITASDLDKWLVAAVARGWLGFLLPPNHRLRLRISAAAAAVGSRTSSL